MAGHVGEIVKLGVEGNKLPIGAFQLGRPFG
jgi:hypothetical protein